MTKRLLEICVDSSDGVDAARRGGADRIELCAALALGGLTPPASLIRVAAAQPLPVHLLARPREGNFVYGPAEQAMIADDIRTAAEAGLAGVVIGASDAERRLDTTVLAAWVAHARVMGEQRGTPLSLTLHRAFDLVDDPIAALGQAIGLGFDRVLTSGGAPVVGEGLATIAALVRAAAGRIAILPGGGVTVALVPALLDAGTNEIHASGRASIDLAPDTPEHRFGFVSAAPTATDSSLVFRLRSAMDATD